MAAISEKNTLPANEQLSESDKAVFHDETLHSAAERGHAATDKFGNSLLTFDKQAEARLRLKIDLYIIPTVAILYLFCFIDRANIGEFERSALLSCADRYRQCASRRVRERPCAQGL